MSSFYIEVSIKETKRLPLSLYIYTYIYVYIHKNVYVNANINTVFFCGREKSDFFHFFLIESW